MSINVGTIDRALRALVGLALLYLAFLSAQPLFDGALVKYGAVVVAIILIATAFMRSCPLYALFGIRTCRT